MNTIGESHSPAGAGMCSASSGSAFCVSLRLPQFSFAPSREHQSLLVIHPVRAQQLRLLQHCLHRFFGSTTNEVCGDFLRHFSDVQWWDSGVVSDGIQRRRQNCCVVAGSDSIKSLTALGEPGYFALAAKFCKSNNQTNPRPTTLDFANSLLDNPRE